MTEWFTLATLMSGFRLASLILAMAMIAWWSPSLGRVLAGRERGRDANRAIWVTLAFSILLFQVRWLAPGLTDLARMRIWVVAQGAMTFVQIAAIYHHGMGDERFEARRTMLVHMGLLGLCIAFAGVTR